ncbi:SDR family oxidoreductase [Streptomyces sp. NPDC057067]|uniref:SDR family oxidoreductase n=1 Tax=unclassified Streptomyces TaxID=2593676 RepID=UPI003629DCEC
MTNAPRTWFVTGASSGLGRALTEALLQDGHRVAATARDLKSLSSLKEAYGSRLWSAELDVTDTDRLRQVTDAAFDELGHIDFIVSNAGQGLYGAAEEFDDRDIQRQFATNLLAPVQLLRSVAPHFRRQQAGHFVQISSAAGQTGMAGGSVYHASKWGVEGFFDSLHDELSPFGVGVTIVEPGAIASSFFNRVGVAKAIDAYESGPVGGLRSYLADPETVIGNSVGDPAKMARTIIDSVSASKPPRRLALGSDSYTQIHQALTARLAAHEAQRELAHTTDR